MIIELPISDTQRTLINTSLVTNVIESENGCTVMFGNQVNIETCLSFEEVRGMLFLAENQKR